MGAKNSETGLLTAIRSQTTVIHSPGRNFGESGSSTPTSHRDSEFTEKRGFGNHPLGRKRVGVLQPLLLSTKEGWQAPPYTRSQTLEQSADEALVQNDHDQTNPRSNSTGGLVYISGSERRLFSDPNSRPFLRFAFDGQAYQYTVLPFGLSLAPRTFTKSQSQLGQKHSTPQPENSLSGDRIGLKNPAPSGDIHCREESSPQSVSEDDGSHGLSLDGTTAGSAEYAPFSTVVETAGTSASVDIRSASSHGESDMRCRSETVDETRLVPFRRESGHRLTNQSSLDRCFQRGLGRPIRREIFYGPVVRRGEASRQ
ncbi:hypothetical protein PO909_024898 [Leuciscus waleckii]